MSTKSKTLNKSKRDIKAENEEGNEDGYENDDFDNDDHN